MIRRFEWDPEKARSNLRKHGVSFEEAILVFRDELRGTVEDVGDYDERRWKTLGTVDGTRLLLVVHVTTEFREDGSQIEVIRVISARKPTKHERRRYERGI